MGCAGHSILETQPQIQSAVSIARRQSWFPQSTHLRHSLHRATDRPCYTAIPRTLGRSAGIRVRHRLLS